MGKRLPWIISSGLILFFILNLFYLSHKYAISDWCSDNFWDIAFKALSTQDLPFFDKFLFIFELPSLLIGGIIFFIKAGVHINWTGEEQ